MRSVEHAFVELGSVAPETPRPCVPSALGGAQRVARIDLPSQ